MHLKKEKVDVLIVQTCNLLISMNLYSYILDWQLMDNTWAEHYYIFDRMFQFAGIQVICARTFRKHQEYYLNKVVQDVWSESRSEVINTASKDTALTVAGDARCDSMGHR